MAATAFRQRKTPGVYVTELDAFPPSVVGVQTAVPVFIGYTRQASIDGKPMYYKPIKIGALVDYEAVFGGPFEPIYDVADAPAPTPADPDAYDFRAPDDKGVLKYYDLKQTGSKGAGTGGGVGGDSRFLLYNSLRLFYANGGGVCYVVSVGNYTADGTAPKGVSVALANFQEGLRAAGEQVGPTMTVIPEAILLATETDFGTLAQDMLKQCGSLQDRVAVLDVYGTDTLKQSSPTFQADLDLLVDQFKAAVGDNFLNYGMAYFPYLRTSIVQTTEINYTNLNIQDAAQLAKIQGILKAEAAQLYGDGTVTPTPKQKVVDTYVDEMTPTDPNQPLPQPGKTDPSDLAAVTKLNNNLTNALPTLVQIENIVAGKLNVLPSSPALAGVYTLVDGNRGVWNAPANTTLTSVVAPTIKLNDRQQGDLNVPLDGKAVDVIREFVGRGSVVWGARTLDGNSADWRYIQVRRTLIYVEQSIKNALNPFVFSANDGNTWVTVVSMVSNFLQGLWSQGGLMGATAAEAFNVECGLGSTMTAQDILDGYLVVQVTLQMIRPAEFIELTFKQKMEGA
jgi:phage tail sheath protein FI